MTDNFVKDKWVMISSSAHTDYIIDGWRGLPIFFALSDYSVPLIANTS